MISMVPTTSSFCPIVLSPDHLSCNQVNLKINNCLTSIASIGLLRQFGISHQVIVFVFYGKWGHKWIHMDSDQINIFLVCHNFKTCWIHGFLQFERNVFVLQFFLMYSYSAAPPPKKSIRIHGDIEISQSLQRRSTNLPWYTAQVGICTLVVV